MADVFATLPSLRRGVTAPHGSTIRGHGCAFPRSNRVRRLGVARRAPGRGGAWRTDCGGRRQCKWTWHVDRCRGGWPGARAVFQRYALAPTPHVADQPDGHLLDHPETNRPAERPVGSSLLRGLAHAV